MFVELIGRGLSGLPESMVEGLCRFGGAVTYHCVRGGVATGNLLRAFPELTEKQAKKLARESCCRAVELGLLGLAGRFFSKDKWQQKIEIAPEVRALAESLQSPEQTKGVMILIPHTTLMEALTVLPVFFPTCRPTSVLYRAFDSPAMESFMKAGREANGVTLLSRREGLVSLIHALKDGQNGALLFDQNSGRSGALISFMGRLAAATDLPDVVARSAQVIPVILAVERTGFWKGRMILRQLESPEVSGVPLTIQAHRWLEEFLSNPAHTTDWLWAHKRWNACASARRRLGFNHKNLMETPTQRKFKVFIRLPNWLGDVVMAMPLLRAFQKGRPDAEITVVGKSRQIALLAKMGLAHKHLGLPAKGWDSIKFCWSLRRQRYDVALALTNSTRSDLELLAVGAPQRFGITRPGKLRLFLTDSYPVSAEDLKNKHQSHIWEAFFKKFGLIEPVSYEPFAYPAPTPVSPRPLSLVPGSANTPEKRWPVASWRKLEEALVSEKIWLLGAPNEQVLTQEVAAGFSHVEDTAGKTDVVGLAEQVAQSKLVVGNDTGAMHLANAFGTPAIILYGPFKPVNVGPIFNTPAILLDCPAGGSVADIPVDKVLEAIKNSPKLV